LVLDSARDTIVPPADVTSSPGKLYVVATPIGNMGDFAGRAAQILATVDVVAAEDTRVSGRLLERFGIRAKLVSYRDENERQLAPRLVRELLDGKSVALVTDAGTPCISDPGYRLVRAASEAGIDVVSIPGPSAVIALLSISGLPTDRFSFEGFPPPRTGVRRKLLESLRGGARTVVFYESPRRIGRFLAEIAEVLGDPEVAVGRELTKMHEEVLRGRASEVVAALVECRPRGEFVVAVHVPPSAEAGAGGDVQAEILKLLDEGLSARDVAERLQSRGISRREVYGVARSRQGPPG
jgi:16S rRNA (cytidine1402-2'-O)-methyltransferase